MKDRHKAYVIVGYNPNDKRVLGFYSNNMFHCSYGYIDYYIPDFSLGKSSYCKNIKSNSPNQAKWFDLRHMKKWAERNHPDFKWRVYRANSKYCPVEVNTEELKYLKKPSYCNVLTFKMKRNWKWDEKK